MQTDLRWLASFSASCLHATRAILSGQQLVDPELADALAEPAALLAEHIGEVGYMRQRFLDHLAALSAGIENNYELAEVVLVKTLGRGNFSDARKSELAASIAGLENAFRHVAPDVAEQLALRGEPMREQWEARGPGLLASVGRLTEDMVLVERADVVLVHPALGGDGAAYMPYNSVHIEAVLANPHAELPEVLRLGWLLSQLNLDVPLLSENIPQDRLPLLAQLATIPPVLTAAEDVELARCDPPTVELALRAWHVEPEAAREPAATLLDWWETYSAGRPALAVALAALDEMLR